MAAQVERASTGKEIIRSQRSHGALPTIPGSPNSSFRRGHSFVSRDWAPEGLATPVWMGLRIWLLTQLIFHSCGLALHLMVLLSMPSQRAWLVSDVICSLLSASLLILSIPRLRQRYRRRRYQRETLKRASTAANFARQLLRQNTSDMWGPRSTYESVR